MLAFIAASLAAGTARAEPTEAEARTAERLEKIRQEPLLLRAFLDAMPKGADLHSHLHSAVFAETLIADAVEDGLCVDPVAKAFTQSQPVAAGSSHTRFASRATFRPRMRSRTIASIAR